MNGTDLPKCDGASAAGPNSAPRKATLLSLQAGRGIAAFFVVLYHANVIFSSPKYWGTRPFGMLFLPGNSGVYYFFVLSGFIIAHAHTKDIGKQDRLFRYVGNRVGRIYPMYWIVTVPILIVSLTTGLADPGRHGFWFLVGDFTLFPFVGDVGTLGVAWTLFHEIVFYTLFTFLIVSGRYGKAVFVAWSIGCTASLFLSGQVSHAFGDSFVAVVFAPINLLFFLGLGVYYATQNIRLARPVLVAVAGVAIYAAVWTFEVLAPSSVGGFGLIWLFGIGSALAVLGLCVIEKHRSLKVPQALLLLGNASYSIYLTHYLALSASAKLLSLAKGVVPELVAFMLLVVLGTSIGIAVYLCVEKPILGAIRRARA